MMLNFLLLLLGFVLLIAGAGKLIDGASSLARRLYVPDIVIGLTIVALGTSAPELVVNVMAASRGESAMVLGNILGSNIFNILVILGVTSMVSRLSVQRNTTWLEIPLGLLSAVLVLVVASDKKLDGSLVNIVSRTDGMVLIGLFLIFLVYNLELARKAVEEKVELAREMPIWLALFWLIAGLVGLLFGGQLIVDNATTIARGFGISERIIAITIISIGTSLPELATSLIAVRKGKVDMAIGNVVGSGIFNVFLILGASAIIRPIVVANEAFPDIFVNIFANLFLFVFLFINSKRQLRKTEGFILFGMYILYILFLLFPDKFL